MTNPTCFRRRELRAVALVIVLFFATFGHASERAWRVPAADLDRQTLAEAQWVRDYGRYTWLVGDEALGRSLQRQATAIEFISDPYLIRLHGAVFDPLTQTVRAGPRTMDGAGLRLVQFRGPVIGEDLAALRNSGLDPFQYVPGFGYLAWGNDSARAAAATIPSVRYAGDLNAALKLQPGLKRRGSMIRNVNVHFYNSGRVEAVVSDLTASGARVLDVWPAQPDRRLFNAVIEVDVERLADLAGVPEVVALSYLSPEPELEDESATQVLAGNLDAGNIPFPGYPAWLIDVDLDGTGVVWATTDTGIWYQHGDYNSRIVGGIDYPGCEQTNPGDDPSSGGHGTHVTGIYAGDASAGFVDSDGFLYGQGMAPGVGVFAQNPICGSGNSWPPAGGWPVLSRDALLGGAIGSNNSWTSGEGTQHGYQATERTYDLMVLDGNFDTDTVLEPFMVVFSAGNSGSAGVTSPKEAKNVVVTGGTQTFRVSGDVDAIYSSSSRGPAVDDRWLPTIAAPGQSVSSARRAGASQCASAIGGTDGEYAFCTGTSMAAPHASGALILLTEWWRDRFGGVDPSPAMGKALLINSAVPVGPSPPPNNDSGWGRIDLSTLVDSGLQFEFWDQSEVFTDSGESFTRTVGVVDPSQPLKITLVWSDAPGAVGANPALVNDLDLTVVNDGQTYLGNNFSGGLSQPGGSPDRLNNIEQVTIDNPGPSAEITIDAFQIAGSVQLDDPGVATAQHFALVCQNCLEQPDFTFGIDPSELSVCVPDSRAVAIDVGSLLGFSDPVSLGVSGLPSGVSGTFVDTVLTPPDSTQLSLSFSGSASAGSSLADVTASSSTGTRSLALDLALFDADPGSLVLTSPAEGAINVTLDQEFSWEAAAQGLDYQLEVALDPDFLTVVHDVTTRNTSVEVVLESSTVHYWRVTVVNACGSTVSETRTFSTRPEPGDCPIGASTIPVFGDDMENGTNGWTLGDGSIENTWQQTTDNSASGMTAWNAENLAIISDQRLVSPEIQLPGIGQLPLTLRFWNHQVIENDGSDACWDGALIEISADSGETWTELQSEVLFREHDGTVNNFSGGPNPLAGSAAWCGDPRGWEDYIVDLSSYAGESIQLRYRLGTDGTVGAREGWTIDDVRVEACGTATIFADGFESAP